MYGLFLIFRHFASKSEEEPYSLFPDPTVDDHEQSSAVSRSARHKLRTKHRPTLIIIIRFRIILISVSSSKVIKTNYR